MINTEFYFKLYNRRRNWEVIKPNKQTVREGSEVTMEKALALSLLELPVKGFIEDEMEKHPELDSKVLQLLKANAEDEIKHDLALKNLREVYPVDEEHYWQVEENFTLEALRLAELYSPITVAGVLEASIFFVVLPMYRFFGSGGFRTIANDISNDENIHTATNVNLAKELGYNRGQSLNKFRQSIVEWLVDELPDTHDDPKMTKQFWLRSSDSLYHEGKALMMKDTKRAVMQSFFEKENSSLPIYG